MSRRLSSLLGDQRTAAWSSECDGGVAVQALFCQVPSQHVLNMHDVQNIWHVPLVLEDQGAHHSICSALNLGGAQTMQLGFWRSGLAERWDNLASVVRNCTPGLGLTPSADHTLDALDCEC
jgi:CTP synthase